jgi:hypothetical protein
MRLRVPCSILVLTLLSTLSVTTYASEIFRGLSWGGSLQNIEPCFFSNSEYEETGVEVYRKENESLSLGSVILSRIEYHFFEDSLFRIVVYVENEEINRKASEAMLEARYGKPKKAFLANKSTWSMDDTTIVWEWPFPGTPDPRIIFTSNRLEKELLNYQKEKGAEQAEKDAASW